MRRGSDQRVHQNADTFVTPTLIAARGWPCDKFIIARAANGSELVPAQDVDRTWYRRKRTMSYIYFHKKPENFITTFLRALAHSSF
jgi:hypothetical protein